MTWYVKAHYNGILPATNSIGSLYCKGLDVEQDSQIGLKWHLVAVDEGYAISQYTVGKHYEYGLGVAANKELALIWYEKAAVQGHFGAKYASKRLNNEGFFLGKQQKRKYVFSFIFLSAWSCKIV